MTFTIKPTPNSRKNILRADKIPDDFQSGIRAGLLHVGRVLIRRARDGMILEKKTGRSHKINLSRRIFLRIFKEKHKASSPGQFPAILTGQTVNGIAYEIRGSSQLEFGIKDRIDRGPKDLPKILEKTRPTMALTDKDKSKDIYTWLRRMPIERMTQK